MSPLERLRRLLQCLHADAPITPHLAEWFLTGGRALLRGDYASLDEALGLAPGPGKPTVAQQYARDQRRSAISICVNACWPTLSPSAQAARLSACLSDPDTLASEPDTVQARIEALTQWHDIPTSRTRIAEILRGL